MSDYLARLRKAFPDDEEVRIELDLAKNAQVEQLTGHTPDFHRQRAMALLFPHRVQHEWRSRMVSAWHQARTIERRQEIGFMGAAMCLAGDQPVLCADGSEIPIKELCERGIAPIVMTLEGPVQAGVPFLKGVDEIWEIEAEGGVRFRATPQHLVLTPVGYVSVASIREGDLLLAYERHHQPSTLGSGQSVRASGASRWSQTAQGSPVDCRLEYRSCGGLLPSVAGDGQSPAPSRRDAQAYTPSACARLDGRTSELKRSPYSDAASHPSIEGGPRLALMSETGDLLHASSAICESLCFSSRQRGEYRRVSNHQKPSSGQSLHFSRSLRPFRSAERYWVSESSPTVAPKRIVAIRKSNPSEEFYDLTVPGAHHYFSGGAIHHNSGKTGTIADILLTLFWEEPSLTTIYCASPTKDATTRRLWAELRNSFRTAKRLWNLPGTLSKGQISFGEDDLRAGIFMVSVDDHGSLIGGNNPDTARGNLILATDELPNIPGNASELLEAVKNLRMRRSFTFFFGGNFAEVEDGMGIASRPKAGYESLDPDTDFTWTTPRNGRIYRFDGMQSPNVLAKQDIFPFLTRWEEVKRYIDNGLTDTADFMRWIRSFPVLGMEQKTVTNSVKIEANGCDKDVSTWTSDEKLRGVTIDPGFGGDPCILQEVVLGTEQLETGRRKALELAGPPITIPIRVSVKGREKQEEAERQIVEYVKSYCEERQILPENVIFDGSMRAGIVQAFLGWSMKVIPIDSGGSATNRMMDARTKKTWAEECSNFTTELWFAFGSAIMSGQIRGIQKSPKAMSQLCARKWKWSGKKKQILPKDEFKATHQGESPNEADAVVLALEWARRKGLSLEGGTGHRGGSGKGLMALFGEMRHGAQVKAFLENKLPAGQLSTTKPGAAPKHGRLNSSPLLRR